MWVSVDSRRIPVMHSNVRHKHMEVTAAVKTYGKQISENNSDKDTMTFNIYNTISDKVLY